MPPAPLPPLLEGSLVEKIRQLDERDRSLSWRVRYPFDLFLMTWRQRLEEEFLRHFTLSQRPDRQRHWDPVTARKVDFQDQMVEPLIDGLEQLEEELEAFGEEESEDSFLMGALYGRWQLALGGLDDDRELPPFVWPVIGGLTLLNRIEAWGALYRQKIRRSLRGMLVGQQTLPESMQTFDVLMNEYGQRLTFLLRNEAYHSAMVGEAEAIRPYGRLLRSMWVTKEDELVCPICAPLHRTITALIPIRDTHPVCRCIKVPVVIGFSPSPVSFAVYTDRRS